LDASESDRRRALDVIDLFKQKETVDELGIGSVRDTIAEILSPGTSTIQTRARYFFFIPWIYHDIEKGRFDRSKVAARIRKYEIDLIQPLLKSEDIEGIIGKQSGDSLQRTASTVYWAGLGRLGFRLFPESQYQYHRALQDNRFNSQRDDCGDIDVGLRLSGNWNPHIPPKPDDFPNTLSLSLTHPESEFFREQLCSKAPDSLFRWLVELRDSTESINYAWDHPRIGEFPETLQHWIKQGQCYAELMHGAQLLYNFMLAEALYKLNKGDKSREWLDWYNNTIIEWYELANNNLPLYKSWDREEFWRALRIYNPNLSSHVENFSNEWMEKLLNTDFSVSITENNEFKSLIKSREYAHKRNRARLFSQVHLELWGGDAGSAKLSYRWNITRIHARDIIKGLNGHA
jgi:hypothetical protein